MSAALEHVYRYAFPSEIRPEEDGSRLRLAVSDGPAPLFFRGSFTDPRLTADLLLAVVRVVHSRFHLPPAMLARIIRESDPVVTCAPERVRFEGFSACCGAYARLDLLPGAVDGALVACGTTNVDFNPGMRAALTLIRRGEPVRLTVGSAEVEVETAGQRVVEKRVPLPLRWLKGFAESSVILAGMQRRLDLPGSEARRFLRALPRGGTSGKPAWVVPSGAGLRLSQVASAQGVRVAGIERLRVLEGIAPSATRMRVYSAPESGACAWELEFPHSRFLLALSPEVWRGFSGEGGHLHALAAEANQEMVERLAEALPWDPRLDPSDVGSRCGLSPADTRRALARLLAAGRAGYDLAEGSYFRRELPFDLKMVENTQPRLKAARELVAAGGVRVEKSDGEGIVAWVRGTGVEHRVRVNERGVGCTCPWYSQHQGARGPCKHILAVQIHLEPADDD